MLLESESPPGSPAATEKRAERRVGVAARHSVPLAPMNIVQVWAKPQSGGALAVLVINASPHMLAVGAKALNFAALNMTSSRMAVRDIWERADVGSFDGGWPLPAVPAFDSVFVRLDPLKITTR